MGPSESIFENLPKRKRSVLTQIILSPIERLSKQLFDIAHEHPEVFLKEPVDEDVFVDQATSSMSTPLETPLGAMLLASPTIKIEPIEYESSYEVKPTIIASDLAKTGGN
ncbi:hypothetical protein L6452_01457 [Arctium lappa]|uniref:Uncharacterized protein n=1 Tax=Arctium lappa TaxID=4217 RepID=A0ACB9FGU0_ARCLA|nr:hypothetical protein L6452_01457 [Arctium lappa]